MYIKPSEGIELVKVTIWNEYRHELNNEKVKAIYPQGIHMAIKLFLEEEDDFVVRTATLDSEENGITQEILDDTDVLTWWGHKAHKDLPDEKAAMIQQAVLSGMGFIALHSAHHSKPFKALMGTSCNLSWREDGDMERVWVVKPSHPIAQGIDRYFELPRDETYAEPSAGT